MVTGADQGKAVPTCGENSVPAWGELASCSRTAEIKFSHCVRQPRFLTSVSRRLRHFRRAEITLSFYFQ
ncbi:hypothetical protein RRG08_058713 [Elysia crispata]|uniref:Uncharacterized protein n=1 Tax=Elysia crispata TaxID=231223 RepID=A0AAE1D6Q1_9GAST|nr:hypothetical protein RRG08_058713 [Elysia crispata]